VDLSLNLLILSHSAMAKLLPFLSSMICAEDVLEYSTDENTGCQVEKIIGYRKLVQIGFLFCNRFHETYTTENKKCIKI